MRLRSTHSGNRQLNAALYRIAITQLRDGPGAAYYHRRRDAGDSHAKALRCLERRIVRKVYGHLRADEANRNKSENIAWCPEELEQLNDQWSRALATLGA